MNKEVLNPSRKASGFFVPKRVVLTGGPSAGKSTLLRHINQEVEHGHVAPEVATMLLSGGFPAPSEQYPWNESWQTNFQRAVAATQIALEDIAVKRAILGKKSVITFDRGLLDGAAYLSGGMRELEAITGEDEATMLGRYAAVLHLTSSAAHDAYQKDTNPHRFEEADAALSLELRTLDAWQNHPCRVVLDNPNKAERVVQGLRIVSALAFPMQ